MSRFFSEALGRRDRSEFRSGNARIDQYFHRQVSQDIKRQYATCHVLVEAASDTIAGFYTLSAYTIPLMNLPDEIARRLPRYPTVPAVLIGWLGRDLRFRGQNIGAMLLADAFRRLKASPVGAYAICADAVDEGAAAFYREHQFLEFSSKPGSFYLPMATIEAL